MVLDFKKLCEISDRTLTDILSGALYGNSGFGVDYDEKEYNETKKHMDKDVCFEDVLSQMILDGKSILITDEEDLEHENEPEKWTLTKDKLESGVEAVFTKCSSRISDFFDDPDMFTDWAFIQCCLFGEEVFG